VKRSHSTLSKRARFRYNVAIAFQTLVSTLDLLGITFFLLILAQSTRSLSVDENSVGPADQGIFQSLSEFTSNHVPLMLTLVVLLFTGKSVLGLLVNYLNIKNLTSETDKVVSKIIKIVFENRKLSSGKYSSHDVTYVLNEGARLSVLDTLYPAAIIFADVFLVCVIVINLFFAAKVIFLPTVVFFCLLFFFLNKVIKRLTRESFKKAYDSQLVTKSLIQEAFFGARELYALGVNGYYTTRIQKTLRTGSDANARISFALVLPKYSYEIAIFLGIALIALVSTFQSGADAMIFNITLFILSSSRIVPALLRIQYYSSLLQKASSQTDIVFEMLEQNQELDSALGNSKILPSRFTPEVFSQNLSFAYPSNPDKLVLQNVSLSISQGETIAIVGTSGSGKSTLVDVLIGFLRPSEGSSSVSGHSSDNCGERWPGRIAYVPQKVTIMQGNVFENVAIGVPLIKINIERAKDSLNRVGLLEVFNGLEAGFEKELGELGANLSGGQIQRIGIARAIYADSDLLIFDESTSALDAQAEDEILEVLKSFRKNKTTVLITHRLNTLKWVDSIVYLKDGKIFCQGPFSDLVREVSEFARQVELLSNGTEGSKEW